MILTLRPPGRGNWKPVLLRVEQSRNAPVPLMFHPGQRLDLGGQRFRVVHVHATEAAA